MFSKSIQSRSKLTKSNKIQIEKQQKRERHHKERTQANSISHSNGGESTVRKLIRNVTPSNQTISQLTLLTLGPLALFYYILSMSMFYQVMGAVRCPKIKKHAGIKLRPLNKAKDPYVPNDALIFSCESEEFTQTIKCLDDGRWSDYPHCPDPSNNTCPDIGRVPHATFNATGPPFKVGSVLAFRCENEILPPGMMIPFMNYQSQQQQQQQQAIATIQTTAATTTTTTTTRAADLFAQNASQSVTFPFEQNYANNNSETNPLRYNLTGHRLLKCLPSSKWNHPVPTCTPIYPEPPSNVAFLLTSTALILIPLLILITVFHLVMKWRERKQQQERWKQYFTDYKFRHSKTNITFGQRVVQPQLAPVTIPVTDL